MHGNVYITTTTGMIIVTMIAVAIVMLVIIAIIMHGNFDSNLYDNRYNVVMIVVMMVVIIAAAVLILESGPFKARLACSTCRWAARS